MMRNLRRGWIGLIVPFVCAGCTTYPAQPANQLDRDLADLTALYQGDFASDIEGGARDGRALYLRVCAITPPDGRAYALYSEMRHDGPDGPFYRQLILLFDEADGRTENRMTALRVVDPDVATTLLDTPNGVADGHVQTKPAIADECYTVWSRTETGFEGWLDPTRCVITGKRGDQRRIEARTQLGPTSMGQLERGYNLEGELLFGNPTEALSVWPRVE